VRKKTVTITPDPNVWKEFKKYCIDQGRTATAIIEEFMRSAIISKAKEKQKK